MLYFIRYLLFTIATILALMVVFPFTILRPLNVKNNAIYFKSFNYFLSLFRMFKIHTENEDILEKNSPVVLIGNHQHNFDVLTVSDLFKYQVAVLGKFEIGIIPIFGQIYVLCGNVLIKRGNKKQALSSMALLEKKIKEESLSILVFPEGTRNPRKKLIPFKKGAFHAAIKSQSPLVPFSISQYVVNDQLKSLRLINIYVKVHDPIPTIGLTNKDIPSLMKKTSDIIEQGILEMNQKATRE